MYLFIRSPRTCCSNTWNMLSEHPAKHLLRTPNNQCEAVVAHRTAPLLASVRTTCSRSYNKVFQAFEQQIIQNI